VADQLDVAEPVVREQRLPLLALGTAGEHVLVGLILVHAEDVVEEVALRVDDLRVLQPHDRAALAADAHPHAPRHDLAEVDHGLAGRRRQDALRRQFADAPDRLSDERHEGHGDGDERARRPPLRRLGVG